MFIPHSFGLLMLATLLVTWSLFRGGVPFALDEPKTRRQRFLAVALPVVAFLILLSPWFDPSTPLVVLLFGLVPMLFYTTVLWLLDHWEREPWQLIAAGFLWGAVPAVMLSSLAEGFAASWWFWTREEPFDISGLIWQAVLLAPVVEESAKGLALLFLFAFFRRSIDTVMDGLVYGAAVGFGFAAAENVLYFRMYYVEWSMTGFDFLSMALMRAFLFGMGHAYCAALTGIGFVLGKFSRNRFARVFFSCAGLVLAMVMHGLHNYLTTTPMGWQPALGLEGFWVLAMGLLIGISLWIQKRWIRRHLLEEVQRNVLTRVQAIDASTIYHSWTARGWQRLFFQMCAKLALLDHAQQRLGTRGPSTEEVEAFRQRVARLGRRVRNPTPA